MGNLWQLVEGLLVGMSERRQDMCGKVQQFLVTEDSILNSLHMNGMILTLDLEDEMSATPQSYSSISWRCCPGLASFGLRCSSL